MHYGRQPGISRVRAQLLSSNSHRTYSPNNHQTPRKRPADSLGSPVGYGRMFLMRDIFADLRASFAIPLTLGEKPEARAQALLLGRSRPRSESARWPCANTSTHRRNRWSTRHRTTVKRGCAESEVSGSRAMLTCDQRNRDHLGLVC